MSTVIIQITELRRRDNERIEDLAEFLEGRLDAKVDVGGSEITVKYADRKEVPSKTHVRMLLRKFLHRTELKDQFRVISGRDNALVIKERKRFSEE